MSESCWHTFSGTLCAVALKKKWHAVWSLEFQKYSYFLPFVFAQNPRHWCVCWFSPTDRQKVSDWNFFKGLSNTDYNWSKCYFNFLYSIDEDSSRIAIGCCVDLFPLVKKVLNYPYEEYVFLRHRKCVAGLLLCRNTKDWRLSLILTGISLLV